MLLGGWPDSAVLRPGIVKDHLASKELVYFALASRIKEDSLFSRGQATTEIDTYPKTGLPGRACLRNALDIYCQPLRLDAFVSCDRSHRQDDSTAQRHRDELDGTGLAPIFGVATFYIDLATGYLDHSLAILIIHMGAVTHPASTLVQSSTVTPGVSMGLLV